MSKKAYIGVDGKARKIKKGYIGVEGVARKIKKAYIGIGGVARPCWSGGKPVYYGAVTSLDYKVMELAAASNDNYAVFLGGCMDNYGGSVVAKGTAYNRSATRHGVVDGTNLRTMHAGAGLPDVAMFGYGYGVANGSSGSRTSVNTITAFNKSLTKSSTASGTKRRYLTATSVGGYVLFAGGGIIGNSAGTYCNEVNCINSSLTATTKSMSTTRQTPASATVGGYALISGGENGSGKLNTVEAFNSSLTKVSSVANMGNTRMRHAGASSPTHAFFAGGKGGETHATVNAYDSSLTMHQVANLAAGMTDLAGATLGDCAIFAGGSAVASVYDASLTRTELSALSVSRNSLAATTIGDFALFGGGVQGSTTQNTVDAYTVA